jgi:hypothetical protein
VRRLEGCLSGLPNQLRLVLELRTGVGIPFALGPVAVANYLHISVRRVLRLERRALRRLRLVARAHACGRATETPSGALSLTGVEPTLGGNASAAGEVEAERYAKSPSRRRSGARASQSLHGGGALLGSNVPPQAGEAMQIVLLAGGGFLLITMLFAKPLELVPRYREWRAGRPHRPPS